MSISLSKGQKITLEKQGGGSLTQVFMGLGWDVAKSGFLGSLFGGGGGIDLDASCVMFDANKQVVDTVWFRQLNSVDGSVRHSGDNRTGDGDGDDEVIHVDLSRVPANVQSLVFTVNSFTGQTFERVSNAVCRLVDKGNNKEVAQLNLSGVRGNHTAVIMSKVYRHNGEWKLHAIGENASGQTFRHLLPRILPHL